MQRLRVFCFLWDDPLFNPGAESAKEFLEDPEFVAFRRTERLLALEVLYLQMAALERSKKAWKETAARHFWTTHQLIERAHIPLEVLEAIKIEQEVNQMDPDFSFVSWFDNYCDEQDRKRQDRIQ
jgi:hypothetical protein